MAKKYILTRFKGDIIKRSTAGLSYERAVKIANNMNLKYREYVTIDNEDNHDLTEPPVSLLINTVWFNNKKRIKKFIDIINKEGLSS